jgi:hypothetical protein
MGLFLGCTNRSAAPVCKKWRNCVVLEIGEQGFLFAISFFHISLRFQNSDSEIQKTSLMQCMEQIEIEIE